ncbi:DNA cytosine methyltransferase [uncultured Aquimarina sp.]|uniref:DNA cytosine methyltransferase n=1 Tax=uncultured Aquimarina sp. TaxID=575652 RepID=UPI0026046872|nr:DNA cytosine methyltransferase [uncultured Aquimarina sp.]
MDCTKEYFKEEQRILSFCYGYGGLERGIQQVMPIKTIAYLEIEAFQIFNLVSAMEAGLVDKAPVWTDIKTFDPKPFHNKVHGIIGGYPCQGESTAGKRKLWKDPRFLWPYIEQSVSTIKPFWCFFENVSGHLSGSFPYVLESLRNLGYKVEAGLFTASEVGATHKRKRLFILALDNSYINKLQKSRKARLEMDGNVLQNQRRQKNSIRFGETSKELGDTSISDGRFIRRSQSRKEKFNESCNNGKTLANTNNIRNGKGGEINKTNFINSIVEKWPSRPGQKQNHWEEPRTIKPGLGSTVNGYDFRTELLRQYGNGVVHQTATKAFDDLLNKHIKNISQ